MRAAVAALVDEGARPGDLPGVGTGGGDRAARAVREHRGRAPPAGAQHLQGSLRAVEEGGPGRAGAGGHQGP
ncbi:hypothetical protein [Ornithinimicrobium kibberense]|uniref:hypothetical protein n=1 Tax=Ornithinimicrobium kibberense TaxID=282060 RepID=UPI0036228B87